MSSTTSKSKVEKVGIVGVGVMGKCMVERLIGEKFEVFCYDPLPAAQEFARNRGATVVGSPRELAQQVKLIVMSLPAPKYIFDVISGENGLLEELTSDHVIVDTSTVNPQTSKRGAEIVSAKGANYVDSPILGRPIAVGNWLMPAGGDEEAIEFAKPALKAFAKDVVRVGDHGAGDALKLLNQLMFSVINGVSAEVMALTEVVGIDKKKFYDVVSNSDAATVSGLFKETARRIVADEYDDPVFTVELLCKDAGLGIEMAKEAGVTPLIAGFVQMLNENAKGKGLGQQDTSALTKVFSEHFSQID
ncbi:MAG TPA: NAD(P)-dependent oxidoreductase [Tepidimicrobium sp.]|nr:NAD(P)-dependent oxidoreductase [Tepidimicrobium sp.]